jgi:hypothetical protein
MKGGAATTTALSDVDVNVTGYRGRDKRARDDCPGARAFTLASDNAPRREEPRQMRALPPRQN